MTKYHINPETGRPNQCTATIKCKYAKNGVVPEHYDSKEAARSAYEEQNKGKVFNNSLSKKKDLDSFDRTTLEGEHNYQKNLLEEAVRTKVPLTDQQLEERFEYVENIIAGLMNRDPEIIKITGYKPYNFYSSESLEQQSQLVDNYVDNFRNVPKQGKAIISGGIAGAGKTTILAKHAKVDLNNYATIDPDTMKEELIKRGMYPKVDGLTPMETAPLIHGASADLTLNVLNVFEETKTNTILDVTMANPHNIIGDTQRFKQSGFDQIDAVFVDVDPDTSMRRTFERYGRGLNNYIEGNNTVGGRFLPRFLVKNQYSNNPKFKTKNSENLVGLRNRNCFTSVPRVFDNNVDNSSPKEISFEDFGK